MRALPALCFATIAFCVSLFAQQNPVPFVNQPLIPASVAPGGSGFTLTVNGTGFVSGSTVDWNGSPRTTTFVSSSQLTAAISSSDIATAMTASLTVASPAPGGGASNIVFLPVREPSTFVSLNATSIGTQEFPNTVVAGDFNRDGNQDIASLTNAPNGGAWAIFIFLGNGDGSFRQGATYSGAGNPNGVLSADVNGDGDEDLIVAGLRDSKNNLSLGVFLGNGDGTFQPLSLYPGNAYYSGVIGDFNRDATLDVAFATGNQVCVFPGNANGSFGENICTVLSQSDFEYQTVGDFNSDGKLDLALTGYNSSGGTNTYSIVVLLGNGDGTFRTLQQYFLGSTSVYGLTTADFNGDGNLDLAVADSRDSLVLIFPGKGDGTFSPPSYYPTAYAPSFVSTADLNGDGKLDLMVAGYGYDFASASVLLGNGDGTFQPYLDFDASEVLDFAIADFNNDGKFDAAFANGSLNTITLLLQDNGNALQLSSNKFNFPIQLVGTVSAPRLITLSNVGSIPVTVSNISVSANFSQLSNCRTIQPGSSCKMGIYFTPTVQGSLVGYVTITDNGGGSPQLVNLSGVATIVSLNPTSLDFGSVPVHHISKAQSVVLTNKGNGPLTINEIAIGGKNAKDFSEVNACPTKLDAGASCTIEVIFHPSVQGARNAILGISDNGGGSPQEVPLTGTGT